MLFARRESGRFHLHQTDLSYALQRITQGKPEDRNSNPLPFSRYALLHRAAEYFGQIRTPRASWGNIEDLVPQLAEFDARVAGEEFDAAASTLRDIDYEYLIRWGHSRLVLQMYKRLEDRLTNPAFEGNCLNMIGVAFGNLADYTNAIDYYQKSLTIYRKINDRFGEETALGNLGICYEELGDYPRAIHYQEQSLSIYRETENRYAESVVLSLLGRINIQIGQVVHDFEYFHTAIKIADETGNRQNQHESYFQLAWAELLAGKLKGARDAIERAKSYDYPLNNAATWTLKGLIRLRQGATSDAAEDFPRAVAEANTLLEKSNKNPATWDTKALALCGLSLCEDKKHLDTAKAAYRSARSITRAMGVVNRELKKFDALAKADKEGILAPLRSIAAGEIDQ